MPSIAVLGANGFIGRNLVTALAANQENEIVAFDRFSDYQRSSSHPFDDFENVTIKAGDFFNRQDVTDAIDGADYVFHLVTATTPASSDNDPFIDVDTNVKSSVELFDICTQTGVKKVIFLSSGGTVYGDIDSNMISELEVPAPRSPYGIGKLTIEHYLRYFKFTRGLDYIVYRVANPYGPGQNIHGQQGVIPIFMHRLLTGQPITVYGDGTMVRDYLYIDDLINMIVGSYDKDNQYSEYNLGSGAGSSVNELITAIEEGSGKQFTKEHVGIPPTFVTSSVLDSNRFYKEFGLRPQLELKDGIMRTWDYVQEIEQ